MGRKKRTVFDVCKSIAEHRQFAQATCNDGSKIKIDAFTASAIVAVEKALSKETKPKFVDKLNKDIQNFNLVANFCLKNVGS